MKKIELDLRYFGVISDIAEDIFTNDDYFGSDALPFKDDLSHLRQASAMTTGLEGTVLCAFLFSEKWNDLIKSMDLISFIENHREILNSFNIISEINPTAVERFIQKTEGLGLNSTDNRIKIAIERARLIEQVVDVIHPQFKLIDTYKLLHSQDAATQFVFSEYREGVFDGKYIYSGKFFKHMSLDHNGWTMRAVKYSSEVELSTFDRASIEAHLMVNTK